jgi:thymidylate synthase (FAD)
MSKVQLVAKTIGVGKYKNLTSEEIISAIARHGIIKEDNGKLVKYLMNAKHWSPLDMIDFTFEIETSRSIGRQILRHQSLKFQEHSTRYSDRVLFENIEIRKEHPTNRQSSTEVFNPIWTETMFGGRHDGEDYEMDAESAIKQHLRDSEYLYKKLINAGVAKECARKILPETLTTTMSAKGSLRSWLSFLNVRLDHHAELEIQLIAKEIGEALAQEMPNIFDSIDWKKGMFL